MKSTIELYVLIAVLTIIAILSTNYITSTLYAANARDYHSTCINEIQASNFAPAVISKLQEQATVTFSSNDEECLVVQLQEVNGRTIGKVTLNYTYAIPFLNIKKNYTISGYAR